MSAVSRVQSPEPADFRASRMSCCTDESSWSRSSDTFRFALVLLNSCVKSCRISRCRCSTCIEAARPPPSPIPRLILSFTSPNCESSCSMSRCSSAGVSRPLDALVPQLPVSSLLYCTSFASSWFSIERACFLSSAIRLSGHARCSPVPAGLATLRPLSCTHRAWAAHVDR